MTVLIWLPPVALCRSLGHFAQSVEPAWVIFTVALLTMLEPTIDAFAPGGAAEVVIDAALLVAAPRAEKLVIVVDVVATLAKPLSWALGRLVPPTPVAVAE